MTYFEVSHNYRAELDHQTWHLQRGQVVDLTPAQAARLVRDSPGVVVPLPPDEQAGEALVRRIARSRDGLDGSE